MRLASTLASRSHVLVVVVIVVIFVLIVAVVVVVVVVAVVAVVVVIVVGREAAATIGWWEIGCTRDGNECERDGAPS